MSRTPAFVLFIALVPLISHNQSPEDALLDAARKGNTAVVETLLAKGANVNLQNKEGDTALIMAAIYGHLNTLQILLGKGANPNAKNNEGWSALMYAVSRNHADIVKALLDKGADINAKDQQGHAVLMMAVSDGRTAIVEALLAKGANPNVKGQYGMTALMRASSQNRVDIVQALLAKGGDVNAKNEYGHTALMSAAVRNHVDVVRALLAKGANPNAQEDREGWTALMYAASQNYIDTVQALLATGADVNTRNKFGFTALTLAENRRHTAIIQLLKGAQSSAATQPKVITKVAESPLTLRVKGIVESLSARDLTTALLRIKTLCGSTNSFFVTEATKSARGDQLFAPRNLTTGANVDIEYSYKNKDKYAVRVIIISSFARDAANNPSATKDLLTSIGIDEIDLVEDALARGADINGARDASMMTALMLAASKGEVNTLKCLLKMGADVNRKDIMGRTALIHAVKESIGDNNIHVVRALLAKGADVTAKDKEGGMASGYARVYGNRKIVQLLEQPSESSLSDLEEIRGLMEDLKSIYPHIQKRAADALERIGQPAVLLLADALKSQDQLVRVPAALVLGRLREINILVAALDYAPYDALQALAAIGPETIPALIKKLDNCNEDCLVAGAIVLAHFGNQSNVAVPSLLQALKDKRQRVRHAAAMALVEIDLKAAKNAVPILRESLTSGNDDVRKGATKALKKIEEQ